MSAAARFNKSLVGVTQGAPTQHYNTDQATVAAHCEGGGRIMTNDAVNMFPQFNSLPSETRGLVWEASLPHRRVFHVRDAMAICPERGPASLKRFTFHIAHRHPVATRVCRESRAAALRRGFFFPKCPDVWFNPDRDMLYIDRNQRRFILSQRGEPVCRVDGLEQVRHVGVEWRAWFWDIPPVQSEQRMQTRWKCALRSLRLCLPSVQTINFVLPQTRYSGGMGFGREPYGASEKPCELTALPGHVLVPWGQTMRRVVTGDPTVEAVVAVPLGRRLRRRLTCWDAIRDQMVRALEDDTDDDDDDGRDEDNDGRDEDNGGAREETMDELGHALPAPAWNSTTIPQVVGLWLIRAGDATLHQGSEVRTFRS